MHITIIQNIQQGHKLQKASSASALLISVSLCCVASNNADVNFPVPAIGISFEYGSSVSAANFDM